MNPDDQADSGGKLMNALEIAAQRGTADGKAAASWCYDGNTPREWYARILQGIADGDPMVEDMIPRADLSGEWADTLTGPQLVAESISEAHEPDDPDHYADSFSEICRAYEQAFSDAAQDEIARAARYQFAD